MTGPRISLSRWGRDHWSTLAYLETRAVDQGGVIKNAHMRTSVKRHPLFAARGGLGSPTDSGKYPTSYRDGEMPEHDDWDCLNDMVEAGLLSVKPANPELWEIPVGSRGPIKYRRSIPTKELKVTVKLTELGQRVAGELRAYKQEKGSRFAEFVPSFAAALAVASGMEKAEAGA